jgi:RNA polymerase subunit RPABC4/transcription elongation factor Spt4
MALQPCRECRHAVSTEALACPSCGAAHPAGVSAGALAVREPAGMVAKGRGEGEGPTPEFWRAMRLLLKRARLAFYGMGSGLLAAIATGSLVMQPDRWVGVAGGLLAIVLCLVAVVLEMLDLNLGKGGANDD